jgi:hypothetical protein
MAHNVQLSNVMYTLCTWPCFLVVYLMEPRLAILLYILTVS